MVKKTVSKYMAAGVSDVLGCFGVPSGAATQLYNDILDKRAQEGVEVLLSEVRQGHFDGIDQNDAVSIVARFQRDAMEGVARNNLRLMARVINGMAEKQELKAPNFLRYAGILSGLSKEEVLVLGMMAQERDVNRKRDFSYLKLKLVGDTPQEKMEKQFSDKLEYIQQALLRTGLIAMKTVSKTKETKKPDTGKNMMYSSAREDAGFDIETKIFQTFKLTPLMDEILKYTDSFDLEEV